MKTNVLIGIALMGILIASGCVTGNASSATATNQTTSNTVPTQTNVSTAPASTTTYTLSDVAPHNSVNDCWMAIHGKVYDVTSFVSHHPGGPSILAGCGIDATDLFETRPMGDGTPHSGRANEMLNQFYIGDLKA